MTNFTAVLEKLKVVEKIKTSPTNDESNGNSEDTENKIHVSPEQEPSSEKAHEESADNSIHINNPVNTEKDNDDSESCDRPLQTTEIYSYFNIPNSDLNTVFMIDNFIRALPENLPSEVKRQSVLNIVSASRVNLNNLITDGKQRLDALNKYAKDFSYKNNSSILQCKNEIEILIKSIEDYQKLIKQKEELFEEQTSIVNYEIQKIQSILQFIAGDI